MRIGIDLDSVCIEFSTNKPLPGLTEDLRRIHAWAAIRGHRLLCISGRAIRLTAGPNTGMLGAIDALIKAEIFYVFEEFHFINGFHKTVVATDLLLDDDPMVYDAWLKHGGNPDNFILFRTEENKHLWLYDELAQISSLKDLPDIVDRLLGL